MPLDERQMDVDQIFDAQTGVDEILDLFNAEAVHVPADADAVVGHLVHHLAIRMAEPVVVLEEVAMPVDVGHDHLLVGQLIGRHQIGVAGIVVDHQLVDLLQSVGVAFGKLLEFHAEPPMRIASRESAVSGHFVELIGFDHLEHRGEEIQPMPAGVSFHLPLNIGQMTGQRFKNVDGSHKQGSGARVRGSRPGYGGRRTTKRSFRLTSRPLIPDSNPGPGPCFHFPFPRNNLIAS